MALDRRCALMLGLGELGFVAVPDAGPKLPALVPTPAAGPDPLLGLVGGLVGTGLTTIGNIGAGFILADAQKSVAKTNASAGFYSAQAQATVGQAQAQSAVEVARINAESRAQLLGAAVKAGVVIALGTALLVKVAR